MKSFKHVSDKIWFYKISLAAVQVKKYGETLKDAKKSLLLQWPGKKWWREMDKYWYKEKSGGGYNSLGGGLDKGDKEKKDVKNDT